MTIDPVTGLIRWVPDEGFAGTSAQVVVKATDPEEGFALQQYEIVVADGSEGGSGNSTPVITSTPNFLAEVDQPYLYDADATDADGDSVLYALVTAPDGMSIDAITGQITWNPTADDLGGPIVVVVSASDEFGALATQGFSIDLRQNVAPEIISVPVVEAVVGGIYRYTVLATDPEGDELTFSLASGPDGMSIGPFGRIIWETPSDLLPGTMTDVEVMVADERGAAVQQSFTITVTADELAPNVGIRAIIGGVTYVSNPQIDVGSEVTLRVTATDNVSVETLLLFVDGELVGLNANGEATLSANTLGTIELLATATDSSGNEGQSEMTITVVNPGSGNSGNNGGPDLPPNGPFDPADNNPPFVQILDPQIITDPVTGSQRFPTKTTKFDIIGTVDDPEDNLWYYQVMYARADLVNLGNLDVNDPDWIQLAQGTDEVVDGKLAELDPTLLPNNMYVIAVAAFDNNGQGWIEPTAVVIEGNLKIGNFRLEFTDLSISLAGIPIEVRRIYDTFDAPYENDFGFGWTLGIQNGQILETVPPGPGGGLFSTGQPFVSGSTKVYLTNPEGRRIGFTFTEEFVSGGLFDAVYRPVWVPDPGVYDSLHTDGLITGGLFGFFDYNPDEYLLTTKDGVQYRYNQFAGLKTVTDLNGNTIVFADDSISHSSGESIQLIRDQRGRIRKIIDPSGNELTYTYDVHGNLTSFTDQAGLVTRFTYQSNPAHFFESATKPNNELALRAVYDPETNEFVGVFDANGNQIDSRENDLLSHTAIIRDGNNNETTLIYDDRGNVVQETDADGHTTFYEYGDPANPDLETRITDRLGNVTERAYDSRGNVRMIVELGGPQSLLEVPVVTEFTYDNGNRVMSITNADHQTTTFDYDGRGNLTEIENVLGDSSRFSYDDKGRRTSFVDFNGNQTIFEYVDGDQPSRVTFADAAYQLFEYNPFGQVTRESFFEADDTLVEINRTRYDNIGRVIEEISGLGDERTLVRKKYDGQLLDWEIIVHPDSLDANGVLTESPATPISDRKSRITDYEYDVNDRLVSQTDAEGGVVHFRYDNQGNRVALMDPVGNITSWVYDANNRVVEERDPLYWDEVRTGDAAFSGLTDVEFLDLVAPIDPGALEQPLYAVEIGVDVENDMGAEHVTATAYDAEGNRSAVIDRNGRRLEFVYDHAGRLLQEDWFAAASGDRVNTLTFTYDAVGNMLTASDLNVTGSDDESHYTFIYDQLNRLESVDNLGTPGVPNVVLGYAYDAQGNVIRTSDNFGVTVSSEYSARNQLSVRTWFDADGSGDVDDARVEMDYSASGRMTEMRRFADLAGNAANLIGRTVRTYDLAGRSDQLNHLDATDINISSYDYDYDFAGLLIAETRVHQMSEFSQEITYGYDLTGQLTEANYSGQPDESFSYDANGNRESSTAHGTAYETETGNRLATDGDHAYEYDGEGNLVLKTKLVTDDDGQAGETTEYQYDHRNRLVAVTIKSSGGIILDEVTYTYDALGRRIARSENGETIHFVYNGDNVWADFDEAGEAVARYLFGNNIDQNIARFKLGEGNIWYWPDRLGTIRDLASVGELLVNHNEFDTFGLIISELATSIGDRFAFAGREIDSVLKLYNFRSRIYESSIGRYISEDRIGLESQDWNLYRFVLNSPTNLLDPIGESAIPVYAALTISIAIPALSCLINLKDGTPIRNIADALCPVSLTRDVWQRVLDGLGDVFGPFPDIPGGNP